MEKPITFNDIDEGDQWVCTYGAMPQHEFARICLSKNKGTMVVDHCDGEKHRYNRESTDCNFRDGLWRDLKKAGEL